MTTIARPAPATRIAPTPFDLAEIERVRVNRSAVERRAASLPGRRTVKNEWQAAWLLRAITCLDLTTLAGDDTPGTVRRLCAKARQPVRHDLLAALGVGGLGIRVAAVCVYPNLVPIAVEALAGSAVSVAAVAAGFPAGQTSLRTKVDEVLDAVAHGAGEIDIVISRAHVLTGKWRALYDEVCELKQAAGDARLKVILAAGELGTLTNVARASVTVLQAGADFLKTSTGKEQVNATLPIGLVMVRAIREHFERTGQRVGFKAAGGIRTAKAALDWLILMKEELGDAWLTAERFRIGASGLLSDIERQLSHSVTGRYSAAHSHPMV
ncbi:MAG: deoxyribose-phosphate aldolase [Dehalococcoidia bacterium]|nr:MAG: deoxyribose-phosphate aldolase [Dehalococcoidia bacterium]